MQKIAQSDDNDLNTLFSLVMEIVHLFIKDKRNDDVTLCILPYI